MRPMSRVPRTQTWLDKIYFDRVANRSNVFLVVTDDPKRLTQLKKCIGNQCELIDKLFNEPENIIAVNLQAQGREQVEVLRGTPITGGRLLSELYQRASKTSTVTIFSWVVTKRHVEQLADFLLFVSQHPKIYRPTASENPSSFVVFTFSKSVWPEELLRFFSVIEVEPSTAEERRSLITTIIELAKRKGYNVEANVEEAVHASSGLTLHDVETATIAAIRFNKPITSEIYSDYKKELLHSWGLEYIEPKYGFEAVGGYDYLKEFLSTYVVSFFRNPAVIEEYGLEQPRGLLMFGPPGTGKTYLAKALAKELGLPMVRLNAADLLRGIVGESERRARRIATILESMAPVVVFIDEADQLFRSRGSYYAGDSGTFQRVQNILLEWLGDEDRKSYIVMATNYLEQFDFAAVRAGRIDYAVPVLLPDRKAREEIIRLHLEILRKPKVKVDVDYSVVAKITTGLTGAELKQVAMEAKILASVKKSPITTDIVEKVARNKVNSVNIEDRISLVYSMLEQARKVSTVVVPPELLTKAEEALKELQERKEEFRL